MSYPEDDADGARLETLHRLRHDLKGPLTVIRGRGQLLARAVQRCQSLTDEERTTLLRGLATIDAAVVAAVAIMDGNDDSRDDAETRHSP